jgi:hypothetical protein
MFHFLLVIFLITPTGDIGMIKAPMPTYETCQDEGQKVMAKATTAGWIAVGTCVRPDDYVGDA